MSANFSRIFFCVLCVSRSGGATHGGHCGGYSSRRRQPQIRSDGLRLGSCLCGRPPGAGLSGYPLLGPVVLKPLLVDDRGVMLSNELELGMIIMGMNQLVERNGQRVLNSSLNSLSLIVGNLIITMDFSGTPFSDKPILNSTMKLIGHYLI